MKNKSGFTLIEMLVVVLIIGILAAVALPQYQKIIAKSKSAQMYEAVSEIAKTAQIFYIVNGSWPSSFDDLDIDYELSDVEDSACGSSSNIGGIKTNGEFEFLIANRPSFSQVSVRLVKGPYKCTGFSMFFRYPSYLNLENKLLCYEKGTSDMRGSKNQQGDFCEGVMKYRFYMRADGDTDYFIK